MPRFSVGKKKKEQNDQSPKKEEDGSHPKSPEEVKMPYMVGLAEKKRKEKQRQSNSKNSEIIKEVKDLKLGQSDFVTVNKKKFFEFYDLLETIGEGAFGRVSKCRHKASGLVRAVKQIKQTRIAKSKEASFLNEVAMLE